jgi:hypothetical protein
MKKESGLFMVIISILTLSLAVLTAACEGQENRSDARIVSLQNQMGIQHSISENSPSKEPISQVVRMMFQDSKGNIWFGTQNGAFKLSGNSLIHMDSIISERGQGVTIKDIAEDKNGVI